MQSKTEHSDEHPMYNWSNPKRVGPGAWYMFMLMSCHAKTKSERLWVCNQIRLFCDFFKCGECNGHCDEYIQNNPPEDKLEGEYELFEWIVNFMNAVNARLHKDLYDINILFRTFTEQEFKLCEAGCGQSSPPAKAAVHSKESDRYHKHSNIRVYQQSVTRDGKSYTQRAIYPSNRNFSGAKYSSSSAQFF
jgi:hypothetical protein